MPSLAILGGGINGVTTGLLLAALGHRPTLYTARRSDHEQGGHEPVFASLYPAASVIPHAVQVDDVVAHMQDTQAFFEVLRETGTCGVRLQPHYEVFESPQPRPAYAPAMRGFAMLPEEGTDRNDVPRRPGVERVYGWHFRTYFAETPTYVRRLYALFRSAGGRVLEHRLRPGELDVVAEDVLVNCLGASGPRLFADERPATVLRGCLVYASPPVPAVHRALGEVASYNYEPAASVYQTASGAPAGLYAYPRTDVWVIGGSKRPGRFRDDGTWEGEPVVGPTRTVDGVDVPDPVVRVNAEILKRMTGVDVRTHPLRATFGYRFARDLDGDGVRLDATETNGRLVVHNYGHGGAGVTLSWSCAVRVARRLHDRGIALPDDPPDAPPRLPMPSDASLLRMLRERARRSLDAI